jgi:branched-chain amino acid transport system permease protein
MAQYVEAAPRIPLRAYRVVRYLPLGVAIGLVVFVLAYVLFIADPTPASGEGNWRTTRFGSAVDDPSNFFRTVVDSVTFAALLFIVASGFTLVFGLMRVVNMAHGSFFLLGGYIALKLQRYFAGGSSVFGLTSDQVSAANWIFPLLIATACIAIVGVVMQQLFLRWNQGQDLRQALITIAISIIAADQIVAHFVKGGAASLTFPDFLGSDKRLDFGFGGIVYPWSRLFTFFVAVGIGIALWVWLRKTRTGMIIRAGVDDRGMVSALGINVQLVFAIAFLVGAALAGLGGVIGGSSASLDVGTDGNWLLNSLVVVIIGGMGSLGGAAVGALLYAFVDQFAALYLPSTGAGCCTQYSSILTFVLLAVVLAVRPLGLFGRPA